MPLFWCLLGASIGFLLDSLTCALSLNTLWDPLASAGKVHNEPPPAVCRYNSTFAKPGSTRHMVIALSGVMLGYACRAMGVGPLHQVRRARRCSTSAPVSAGNRFKSHSKSHVMGALRLLVRRWCRSKSLLAARRYTR